jgi:hypothetical protein
MTRHCFSKNAGVAEMRVQEAEGMLSGPTNLPLVGEANLNDETSTLSYALRSATR